MLISPKYKYSRLSRLSWIGLEGELILFRDSNRLFIILINTKLLIIQINIRVRNKIKSRTVNRNIIVSKVRIVSNQIHSKVDADFIMYRVLNCNYHYLSYVHHILALCYS